LSEEPYFTQNVPNTWLVAYTVVMRINKYIALSTGLSRRVADKAVEQGNVLINGKLATAGQNVADGDVVTVSGKTIAAPATTQTIIFNKPIGYVVSRDGQGSKTIYDLLPKELHHLKPIGRLDKDSSGLLLLTNDGKLAQELTHPRYQKTKIYEVRISTPLQPLHRQMISDHGLQLTDGPSKLQLERMIEGDDKNWRVTMHEGRNRQIRRTFAALGYGITRLHRTQFGSFTLKGVLPGHFAGTPN
jgi:23S rRNA pseudouridine2605 synthase